MQPYKTYAETLDGDRLDECSGEGVYNLERCPDGDWFLSLGAWRFKIVGEVEEEL